MMKQSKKTGKLLACLLTLALSCAAAGCGNSNDSEGQEASAAPEADSQAPESIGAEADVDTQLDEEAEATGEPETPTDSEPIQPSNPRIHIEAQELYNDNDIVVTIPEQTISPSTMPTFHLECQYDHSLFYSFLDLTVDGELIMSGSHSTSDGEINPDEPSDNPIPVDFWAAVDSGRESGEITFVLDLWDDILTSIDKPEISIPYTVTTE